MEANGRAIQDAPVATLAMEFCEVITTAEAIGPALSPDRGEAEPADA